MAISREDLENQVTSITLQKEALHDEVSHVHKEMSEIRNHLDRVNEDNAILNKVKSELEVKVTNLENDLKQSDERINFLRSEKSEQNEALDDLNFQISMMLRARFIAFYFITFFSSLCRSNEQGDKSSREREHGTGVFQRFFEQRAQEPEGRGERKHHQTRHFEEKSP